MSQGPMVSCQVVLSTLNYLRAEGIPHDRLLEGLPYPRSHLERASRWIDHATFLEFHRRVADLLDHDARRFYALGLGITAQGWIAVFTPLTQYVITPYHFYATLPWVVPRHVMTFLDVTVARLAPARTLVRYHFAPGTEPDALVAEVFRGNLAAIATWFGQPAAEVEAVRTAPSVVDYRVTLRARPDHGLGTWWGTLRRHVQGHWRRVVEGETIPRGLLEANVHLAHKVEELSYARDELTRLNQRLQLEVRERDRADRARQELAARMQEAQKLETLGVLAGGIAHDFNNLLVGILASVELAQRAVPTRSPAQPHHQRIDTAARRAAELCRLMLTYAGQGPVTLEAVDLAAIAREMADLVHASRDHRERVVVRVAADLPPVHGDAALLRQILVNLLTNAVEATGDDGAVTLDLEAVDCSTDALLSRFGAVDLPAGQYVRLRVTDTGCGMDADTLTRAFDPFFTTKFTGRGLGLAAVQGAVRRLRGALHVQSRPGAGSCFEALVPAAPDPLSVRAANAERPVVWTGAGTVLLVDDEADVREVGQEILEAAGYEVLVARDGREALRVFQERSVPVDCVLLDLTMPHLDGIEACRELRKLAPELRVLLTSGYSAPDVAPRLEGLGPCRFLAKPFTASGLLAAIHETLAG